MVRLTTEDKPREPEFLTNKMKYWRIGVLGMPTEYIDYHLTLAREELNAVAAQYNLKVHVTTIESDGWFDGMNVLFAVVQTPTGKSLQLKWNDTNRSFMSQCPGGGWSPVREEELK